MNVITIPHGLAKNDDLVVLPRKKYEQFLRMAKKGELSRETEYLELQTLSKEAKVLRRKGQLPVLKSLRELR